MYTDHALTFGMCFFMTISGVLLFSALTSKPETAVIVTPEHDRAARIYYLLTLFSLVHVLTHSTQYWVKTVT